MVGSCGRYGERSLPVLSSMGELQLEVAIETLRANTAFSSRCAARRWLTARRLRLHTMRRIRPRWFELAAAAAMRAALAKAKPQLIAPHGRRGADAARAFGCPHRRLEPQAWFGRRAGLARCHKRGECAGTVGRDVWLHRLAAGAELWLMPCSAISP